ncbi:unnamed protein product [Penicillium salamii]|nr:unnamed protein product [Penicillium salamii]CAG8306407.1 unnamed protein product [Penicillium salamii]
MFLRREEDHIHNDLPPLVGYVHYTSVNRDRRRQFEPFPGPRGNHNDIGMRICLKRITKTSPKNWTEDPYFICHLLALAQYQERKLNLSKSTTYTVSRLSLFHLHLSVATQLIRFRSRLLVTNVLDREGILYYEAQITTELLNVLKNPKGATSPINWPTIRHKKITYKPYDTFPSRLVAELVTPSPLSSCGLSNPSGDATGTKRPHEQQDDESCKQRRISES